MNARSRSHPSPARAPLAGSLTRAPRFAQAWCGGVTRDWKGAEAPRICRKRLYELRKLPLATYQGHWTGYTSWLPVNQSCEPPQATPVGQRPLDLRVIPRAALAPRT